MKPQRRARSAPSAWWVAGVPKARAEGSPLPESDGENNPVPMPEPETLPVPRPKRPATKPQPKTPKVKTKVHMPRKTKRCRSINVTDDVDDDTEATSEDPVSPDDHWVSKLTGVDLGPFRPGVLAMETVAAAANPTNTPAMVSGGLGEPDPRNKKMHRFFSNWLEENMKRGLPAGVYSYQPEVTSGLMYPYKRVDNVVYLLDRPEKRYIIVEYDPYEHKQNGLVEDVFRINWFKNARFKEGKVYVVRLNPSMYHHKDGMKAEPPPQARLAKLLQLLRFIYESAVGEESNVVKCYYLYYSYSRLQQFKGKVACELQEVERDVMYCLSFASHENPAYLQPAE